MHAQQVADVVVADARRRLGWDAVGDELDRLLDLVDDAGRDGVEPVRFTSDDDGRDREDGDRGDDEQCDGRLRCRCAGRAARGGSSSRRTTARSSWPA